MTCWFLDRNGNSIQEAIIIYADNFIEKIGIIFDYLIFKHGKPGSNWKILYVGETYIKDKRYEIWNIEVYGNRNKSREIKTYYFDVSGVKNSKKIVFPSNIIS